MLGRPFQIAETLTLCVVEFCVFSIDFIGFYGFQMGFQKLCRLRKPASIHVGLSQVVVKFTNGLSHRDRGVLVGFVDVTEFHELLHRLGALHTVEVGIRRMHAVGIRSFNLVP